MHLQAKATVERLASELAVLAYVEGKDSRLTLAVLITHGESAETEVEVLANLETRLKSRDLETRLESCDFEGRARRALRGLATLEELPPRP